MRSVFRYLLLILLASRVWGADVPDLLKTAPTGLLWAVSPFQTPPDDALAASWAISLPKLLVRGWDGIDKRVLTADDQAALRKNIRTAARVKMETEEAQKLLAKDQIFLTSTQVSKDLAAWDVTWQDYLTRKKALDAVKDADIPLPDTLPLKLYVSSEKDTALTQPGDRYQIAASVKADLLVGGEVRSTAGYLHVRVEIYSAVQGKVLREWTSVFSPDEAPEQMQLAREDLQEDFLGRPWASLRVESPTEGTLVRFGDAPERSAPWTEDFLTPGPLTLKIRLPGEKAFEKKFDLEADRSLVYRLETPEPAQETLTIDSDPTGASVWINSRFFGLTPLEVPKPNELSRVKVLLPGFQQTYAIIGATSPEKLDLHLVPDQPLPSIPDAKDRFYTSLAFFSFSLTTTIFLRALTDQQIFLNEYYALDYANNPTAQGYQNFTQSYYWQQGLNGAFWTGVALTSGLFVWMMWELNAYLNAAEAPLK